MKDKFLELKKFFDLYTAEFDLEKEKDQKNIQLKIDHSKRVVENMEEIIREMSLNKEEKYLAKIIALFHDIGRFKQYKKYRTFSDYKSEDHSQLGIELIKENELIDDLNQDQQNMIFKAIKQHNKADLNLNLLNNEQEIFFARLIRDADKLDIFNIFAERYKNKSQEDYIIKLSTKAEINNKIYNKVLKKESINYDKLETIADLKAMQLGWIFDINFKETIEIIKEREYIEIIYNSMEQTKQADKIYQEIKSYIQP